MIIAVSIVDLHKPNGSNHVGTYMFEIDYPGDSHFSFLTLVSPVDKEDALRPHCGKLETEKDIPDPLKVSVGVKTGEIISMERMKS